MSPEPPSDVPAEPTAHLGGAGRDATPSSEARLAALLETVPALLFSLDPSGVFTSC